MTATESQKKHEPKVPKYKGNYSSNGGIIFQSWLKDIKVHVKERQLTKRGGPTGQDFYIRYVRSKDRRRGVDMQRFNSPFEGCISI